MQRFELLPPQPASPVSTVICRRASESECAQQRLSRGASAQCKVCDRLVAERRLHLRQPAVQLWRMGAIPRQYIEKRERLRAVAAQFGADLRTAALQFSAAPDVAAASQIGWRAASLHGHVPGNLLHPPLVRVNGNAGDLHPSARHQVHPVVPSDHASGRVEPLVLPARSPNLNAYAERWVRSVKEECLSKVILFGERSLRRARANMSNISIASRNHQGRGNVLLFPRGTIIRRDRSVLCRERLGGLLRYYHQEAG